MAEAMRKGLRRSVRGVWATDAAYDLQLNLSDTGLKLVSGHFRDCARKAVPIIECYAEKGPDLKKAYKGVWGKPTP